MEEENNDDSKNWVLIIFQNLALNLVLNMRHMTSIMSVEEIMDLIFIKNGAIKEKKDGMVISRKYTCCKGGNKTPWERDGENKYDSAKTRTGCNAHMIIWLDKKKGKYFIHSLELNHNHIVHIPQCAHMMPSQLKVSKAQAIEIDLAYDSGIKLKNSYEFMARQVGGRDAL